MTQNISPTLPWLRARRLDFFRYMGQNDQHNSKIGQSYLTKCPTVGQTWLLKCESVSRHIVKQSSLTDIIRSKKNVMVIIIFEETSN